jgi:septin family protein
MGNKNGGESAPADLQKSQDIDRMILGDKSARRGKTTILLIGNSSNGKNQFLKELRNQICSSSPSIMNENEENDGEIDSEVSGNNNDTTKVTDFEFTFENNPYRVIDPGVLFENQKNFR